MEKNKTWVWIVLILIIGAIMIFTLNNKEEVAEPIVEDNTQTEVLPDSTQDLSEVSDTTTGSGSVSIAYADALIKYNDRRIQLDPTCQAHPNTVTYKDNTGIMIDNRSDKTRTVKIGSTFTIKPYGFKIVVLPNIYLEAKTILVDCDQSQNVATILVQE